MGEHPPDLRREIETLLQDAEITAVDLRRTLEELAAKNPRDFRKHADLWALALFQRDAEYYGEFVTNQLDGVPRDIIQSLLTFVEVSGSERFFSMLYEKLYTEATWNQELVELAQSSLPDDALIAAVKRRAAPGITWRSPRWSISDEAANLLYRRSPTELRGFVYDHAFRGKVSRFDRLRELAEQHGDMELYWLLFRKGATAAEWRQAVEQLLTQDIDAKHIEEELRKRQPDRDIKLEEDSATPENAESHVWQSLFDKYGKAIEPFLIKHMPWYFRRKIEEILARDLTAVELMQELDKLARTNWRLFGELAEVWAATLHSRYPDESKGFLRQYLNRDEAVHALLPQIEAAGQDDLFRYLYRQRGSRLWHSDAIRLAESDLSDSEVMSALQKRRSRHWKLNSDAALALYRRNRALFRPLIWAHIISGKRDVDRLLLQEIEHQGDMDMYWQVFRHIADWSMWHDSLEQLLAEDIPADRIVTELEKRHVDRRLHIQQPDVWLRLIQKYGSALAPYLERNMRSVSRRRLEALLALDINRGTLLQELDKLARQNPNDFRALAEVWAPALYSRSPEFFKTFLIRNLNRWSNAPVIYKLLERAEADGHDDLFRDLYRAIARRDEWEKELLTLAKSSKPDDEVLRAVLRRTDRWASLTSPETALALYRRNPALFNDFLRDHTSGAAAESLRDQAQKDGVVALYQHFQHVTPLHFDPKAELKRILDPDLTLIEILERLERFRYRYWYDEQELYFDSLFQLLERHGEPILPFLRGRIPSDKRDEFLEAVDKLGNRALYWQEFFAIHGSSGWNESLRELIAQPLDHDALLREMQFRRPIMAPLEGMSSWRWRSWSLDQDLAVDLYKRDPVLFRPFIEPFIDKPSPELYQLAEANGDEEFLDFLTVQLLQESMYLAQTAHRRNWWTENVQEAQERLKEIDEVVRARFDRLYAASPELYVRHAAMMLGRFRAFEIRSAGAQLSSNPVFSYVATQHRDSWRRSPAAMRDLMESPNIFVQIIGLEMMDEDSIDAAERVIENLTIMRALLLGRTRPNTKQRVLRCLDQAARQGPRYADLILPLLEEAKDLHGSRSISELVLVSYVRLKHEMLERLVTAAEA